MSWLDALTANNAGMEKARQERRAQLDLPTPKARVVESCWTTVRQPNGNDHGSIEAVWWFVEDGMLHLCTEQGDVIEGVNPVRLNVGEQPRAVAGRLARRKREAATAPGSVPGFNRSLRYGPSGVV